MDERATSALKTGVLLVLFAQLMCDALDRAPETPPTRRVPVSTVDVCELAVEIMHGRMSDRAVHVAVDVPDVLQSPPARVSLIFEWILAALNALPFASDKTLFMALFARVVLRGMPFASSEETDASDEIPRGIRAGVAGIINTVHASASGTCATKEQQSDLRARIRQFNKQLHALAKDDERAKLRDVKEHFLRCIPFLSAVTENSARNKG
jgi:hypothetical protein